MIAYITGKILEIADEYIVIVTQGGVGYKIRVLPGSELRDILEVGGEAEVFTSQTFSENDEFLYGFKTSEERNFFEFLTTVSGVGPKVAAKLLSSINYRDLARMILEDDPDGIIAAPGIGRKLAQKIVIELRDRILGKGFAEGNATFKKHAGKADSPEVVFLADALRKLGFSSAEIKGRTSDIIELLGKGKSVEEVLREVLSR